jgi:sulfite reductase beta subunit-like hemoprotein
MADARVSPCAAAVGRTERRWQYTHDRVRQRMRRLHDASDAFRQRYRWRAGIEATMSRFKSTRAGADGIQARAGLSRAKRP